MNTATSNGQVKRFTASEPCPVCSGSEHDARGQGQRCHGYISGDRKFIFCARDEHAGKCKADAGSGCYRHVARGPCPCGKEHAPADPGPSRRGEIDRVYKYHGPDGTVLFEVVRTRNPKGFRQRRRLGNGQYEWNLKGVTPVLYKLPELLAADPSEVIWIAEGEKDVENLGAKGLVATCNPMGAKKWRDHYSEALRGRHVVILPDNDQDGRDHAQQVARSLHGVAASVRIVELSGLPEKGDASDFLAAGGTLDQLRELAGKVAAWMPLVDDRRIEVNEAKDDPHRLARIHLKAREIDGQATQRFYRGETLEWSDGAYRPIAEGEAQSRLTGTIKGEFNRLNVEAIKSWQDRGEKDEDGKPAPKPEARKVTRTIVSNATLALQSMTLLPGKIEAPAWINGSVPFDAAEIMPIRNALVHLPAVADLLPWRRPAGTSVDRSKAIIKPTPRFFSTYALGFDFNLDADPPLEWIRFLGSIWPKDGENVEALQEWIGYLLTADTSHQKIGLFIGPSRSGRGTIARIIAALIGRDNVAGPTFNSLGTNFGLSPLIGKPVAIVGDARISGRSDWAVIVERLLSISGEDAITIDRKHLLPWTGRLRTRFILISNELPRLPDVSGALVNRYLVFRLTRSFLGQEDRELDTKLEQELPGILLWAIEGWRRLRERGHFVQPKSGQSLIEHARDISSPMGAFVRERCELGPGFKTDVEHLFGEWCSWCEPKKREPGNETSFGRDLRTVIPDLEIKPRRGNKSLGEKSYVRYYEGVRVKEQDDEPAF